jgi:hypothetical protein
LILKIKMDEREMKVAHFHRVIPRVPLMLHPCQGHRADRGFHSLLEESYNQARPGVKS